MLQAPRGWNPMSVWRLYLRIGMQEKMATLSIFNILTTASKFRKNDLLQRQQNLSHCRFYISKENPEHRLWKEKRIITEGHGHHLNFVQTGFSRPWSSKWVSPRLSCHILLRIYESINASVTTLFPWPMICENLFVGEKQKTLTVNKRTQVASYPFQFSKKRKKIRFCNV